MKKYTRQTDQARVKQELEDTSPIVVRFYKESCPACQMSSSAWEKFSPSGYRKIAVEEEAIPPEILNTLEAFPTYAVHDQKGSNHVEGAITDPSQIMPKLRRPNK